MNFTKYQADVARTASENIDFDYHTPAITGEAGEVAELFKKYKYHGKREFEKNGVVMDFLTALEDEVGDVLWGLTNCLNYFGLTLEGCAIKNCEKRALRYPNGFVLGGGNR